MGMPIAKTFFSSRFAILTDRFGVAWMIVVQAQSRPLCAGRAWVRGRRFFQFSCLSMDRLV